MEKVRLYVVDDEALPIRYFKSLLAGKEEKWDLIGEASNGRKAYQEILRLRPDIVFVDISMPVMNGLQLSERLLYADPTLKIVLLTAYRDFEYAQKGIQLGVSLYVLKHELNEELLDQIIEKVCRKAKEEREKTYWYSKKHLETFLRSGKGEPDVPYRRQAEGFCLMDLPAEWGVPLFEQDRAPLICRAEEIEHAGFPEGTDCCGLLQMDKRRWTALFAFRGIISRNELQARQRETAYRLMAAFARQGLEISVLISRVVLSFSELPEVYRELHRCRRYAFFRGNGQFVLQTSLLLPEAWQMDPAELLLPVTRALENSDWESARNSLRTALVQTEECGTIRQYQSLLQAFYYTIQRVRSERTLLVDSSEESVFFRNIKDAHSWAERCISSLAYEERESTGYSEKVRCAIRFIQKNFRCNLSAEEIAENCRLSERYLRKMFKEETGTTMLDYLTEYRVERAKVLLRQSGVRPGEIYAEVGFTSAQYFSSVFKKVTGESPSEFSDRWKQYGTGRSCEREEKP